MAIFMAWLSWVKGSRKLRKWEEQESRKATMPNQPSIEFGGSLQDLMALGVMLRQAASGNEWISFYRHSA
jgi:hypothetical protein